MAWGIGALKVAGNGKDSETTGEWDSFEVVNNFPSEDYKFRRPYKGKKVYKPYSISIKKSSFITK